MAAVLSGYDGHFGDIEGASQKQWDTVFLELEC